MLVGIDFDNTVVCYDPLFHRIAVERKLIPAHISMTKGAVRDYLRTCDREDAWTALQGYVYGERMQEALPFPGVRGFVIRCNQLDVPVRIISHKTTHPFAGPQYDLHGEAHAWLHAYGFYESYSTGLGPEHVHFELTKAAKLTRITAAGCDWFVDDLPEFLAEPDFPSGVQRILFDPGGHCPTDPRWRRAGSWAELEDIILCRTTLRA